MKIDIETDKDTGNQALALTAEDYLDVSEFHRLKGMVEGNGLELDVSKDRAVLRAALRLRAQKSTTKARGRQSEAPDQPELPAVSTVNSEGIGEAP